jgi:cytochrome c oxidase subunit 2
MTGFILGVSAILILIILLLIFRVQSLVAVLKGTYNKKASLSNKVNAILFPISFTIGMILLFWYSDKASEFYLPKSASFHGEATDSLFWITTYIVTAAFIITHILLFWFAYKYQYKEGNKATFFPDSHKLELIWTVIPAIVLTILVVFGYKNWSAITSPTLQKDRVEIEVMGKQFAWQVRYAGKDGVIGKYNYKLIDNSNEFGMDMSDKNNFDDFTPREIHIPKGRQIMLKIRARDVLHSVFLPHFRVKMDAVPGMPTSFAFTPKYTTAEMAAITGNPTFKYELACTEICGRGHYAMRFIVVVEEEEDYKKWYVEQKSWLETNPDYVNKIPENLRQYVSFAIAPKAAEEKVKTDSSAVATVATAVTDSLKKEAPASH